MSTETPLSQAEHAAGLRVAYPWAVASAKFAGRARVARNVRQELAVAYPKVRFRVRRSGDGVVVAWAGGPLSADVAKLLTKYQERSHSASTPLDAALDELLGPSTWVDTERTGGGE